MAFIDQAHGYVLRGWVNSWVASEWVSCLPCSAWEHQAWTEIPEQCVKVSFCCLKVDSFNKEFQNGAQALLCSAPSNLGKRPTRKLSLISWRPSPPKRSKCEKREGRKARNLSLTLLTHLLNLSNVQYSHIPYIKSQNINDLQSIRPVCLCFPWGTGCFHDSPVSQCDSVPWHPIRSDQSGPIPISSSKKESHDSQQLWSSIIDIKQYQTVEFRQRWDGMRWVEIKMTGRLSEICLSCLLPSANLN